MISPLSRFIFGMVAMALVAATIGLALSPWVPADRVDLASLVLGHVLTWPVILLSFYFGSSEGSKAKTQILAEQSEMPQDVHVTNEPGDAVPVEAE